MDKSLPSMNSHARPKLPNPRMGQNVATMRHQIKYLRYSRRQPNLSAYEATFGNFNFNGTPLAPPGTRVLVHKTTEQRASFAPHGVDGWFISPSLDHYQCYNCYILSTAGTRDAI